MGLQEQLVESANLSNAPKKNVVIDGCAYVCYEVDWNYFWSNIKMDIHYVDCIVKNGTTTAFKYKTFEIGDKKYIFRKAKKNEKEEIIKSIT